jgi:CRP/FNR family cyclic AMP-dependent transcriptional regulator
MGEGLSMQTTAKNLSDVPAINRFLSYCRVRTVPQKTVMIHAGDLPDVLYYIVDGSVEVMIPHAARGFGPAPSAKSPR